VDQPINQRINN